MSKTKECPDCGTERDNCRCREFPGWTPESGESRFGYPLPPSMQRLSADEVRQWGIKALDTMGDLASDREDIQRDSNWLIDASCWAASVLEEVEKVIGTQDSVLLDYAATMSGDPLTQRVDWAKEGF